MLARRLLNNTNQRILQLDEEILAYDREIEAMARRDEQAKRLMATPGIGFLPLKSCRCVSTEVGGSARPPTAAGFVIIAYSGRPSNSGTSPIAPSQTALLDVNICAVGNTETSVSKHPAGTTSRSVYWGFGNAEPHDLQKLLLWRVPGSVKEVTASKPASQVSLADCENKFAA